MISANKNSNASLQPKRIFLGFHNIALYQSHLKKGLEALGCRVTRIAYGDDLKFGQDDAERIVWFRWLKRAMEWNRACWQRVDRIPKTSLLKLLAAVWILRGSALTKRVLQWCALLWTMARHDVIVLSYCGSFLESSDHTMEPTRRTFRDLKLIKRAGRMLIFTFHGSDSRPPYLDGYVLRNPRRLAPALLVELTRSRRRLIEGIEQYADYLVSVPAQTYFHMRPVVLHEYLGRPFETPEGVDPSDNGLSAGPLVVLHAPSNPHAKGTDEIRRAMARLRESGLTFEYVEVTRRPHAELLEEIRRATLVVDQMYSDRMITGVATEAMYFGKPVVVAGYYADYYRRNYEGRMPLPPTVFCTPDKLEDAVRSLLNDPERRGALGRAGAEYVRTHFSPEVVARRWLEMIAGRLPAAAFFDPYSLTYPLGAAISRDEAQRTVAAVVAAGGRDALCLADKPELETAVMALAQ
jgi:hypothetical protein